MRLLVYFFDHSPPGHLIAHCMEVVCVIESGGRGQTSPNHRSLGLQGPRYTYSIQRSRAFCRCTHRAFPAAETRSRQRGEHQTPLQPRQNNVCVLEYCVFMSTQARRNLARCGRCGAVFTYTVSNRDVLYRCHDCNTPNMIPGLPIADPSDDILPQPAPRLSRVTFDPAPSPAVAASPPERISHVDPSGSAMCPPQRSPQLNPLLAASAPSTLSLSRMASISRNRIKVLPA